MGNIICLDCAGGEPRKSPKLKTLNTIIHENYRNLKKVKILHKNRNTVYLLEDNIVRKDFGDNLLDFYNEADTYLKLSGLPFILKPYFIDYQTASIYLPYIDSRPPKTEQNRKIVNNYLSVLRKNYHIIKKGEYIWCNLLYSAKKGQIYMIDFGNIPWNGEVFKSSWVIRANKSIDFELVVSK